MLRVMRNHRRAAYNAPAGEYEGLTIAPMGIDPALLPGGPARGRARETGTARWPRRAARLPQRAGHRARPDRHHRPAHGLRHHRHRAGLRAGEVQEARRRRLLQDRQPEPARWRCASSATPRRRSTTIVGLLPWARARSRGAPAHQPRDAARQAASTRPASPRSRPRSRGVFDITLRVQRAGRSARTTSAAARPQRGAASAEWNGDLLRALGLHRRPRSRRPTTTCCGTMTVEGAPHLQAEHYPVFDCANRCGKKGKRFISADAHIRDDGGGAAVHLRRDQQDHQHAERRDRRGRQARLPSSGWQLRLKAVALYRDGSKLSQPLNSTGRRRGGTAAAADVAGGGRAACTERVVTSYLRERHRLPDRRARLHAEGGASAATRSTCAPASTRTARSARSSSTCTRKAPPSAR